MIHLLNNHNQLRKYMKLSSQVPDIKLEKGQKILGFIIENITPVPDIRSIAYEIKHEKSGAKILHLHNQDTENLFSVAFRTPPYDDTGLPHILEHSVLCGSQKYPVKDPFVELLKKSLATFLNAMTYPDKTVYPCASMVEKDFFNLMSIYCDAVFHPLLKKNHFMQEGHHLAFSESNNKNSPLIIKGIVYNEMKGHYSDLDGIIDREIISNLCPDNAYGFDYGGNPEKIPELTYEQFTNFHSKYYHPSNSRFFLYGDIFTEKHLEFLNPILDKFNSVPVDSSIAAQSRWIEPKYYNTPYPVAQDEDLTNKVAIVLSILTNDVTDAIRSLSMNVLDYYLLGNEASPLRKALIDSGLGEDLTDSGYADFQRDTYFCVGMKGTEKEKTQAIIDLIKSTCSDLVKNGLEKEKIEASFHRLEFSSLEIQGMYPLSLMDRVYRSWIYDADPLYNLRIKEHLLKLRDCYEKEENFFEQQLQEIIVDNPHFCVSTFYPDPQYMMRKEKDFQEKMKKIKDNLSNEEINNILKQTQELENMQTEPNSEEALATLPYLKLEDVPPDPIVFPTTIEKIQNVPVLYSDVFSNGVNYIQLAFDLRGLDEELLDFVPLYSEAFCKMGAGDKDYVEMAELEALETGGIYTNLSVGGTIDQPSMVRPFLSVASKALDKKLPKMLDLLFKRIVSFNPTDIFRLKDVITQEKNANRSSIMPNGSHYALLYAKRHLSKNTCLAERLEGFTQIRKIEEISRNFETVKDDLVDKLVRIREFLLSSNRITVSFVGGEKQYQETKNYLEGTLEKFTQSTINEISSVYESLQKTPEAIAVPADVAFVAAALPAVKATHTDAPVLLLMSVYLSFGYLWEEVRVKRGAYGARAQYDTSNAVFTLSSYRDPFIKETLDTYQKIFDHVSQKMDLSPDDVEQAIIGTVKTLDRPLRPSQVLSAALYRYLNGETLEFLKNFRQRLFSIKADDILRVNEELLRPGYQKASVCVLSSQEKLDAANKIIESDKFSINKLF